MSDPLSKISSLTLPPVILCIGSDRVLGDALGPITGELLKKKFDVPAFVYGSLSTPVNALNLGKAAAFIASRHRGAKIVAIDGSVGSEIGKITVSEGSLRPGLASGKVLPRRRRRVDNRYRRNRRPTPSERSARRGLRPRAQSRRSRCGRPRAIFGLRFESLSRYP